MPVISIDKDDRVSHVRNPAFKGTVVQVKPGTGAEVAWDNGTTTWHKLLDLDYINYEAADGWDFVEMHVMEVPVARKFYDATQYKYTDVAEQYGEDPDTVIMHPKGWWCWPSNFKEDDVPLGPFKTYKEARRVCTGKGSPVRTTAPDVDPSEMAREKKRQMDFFFSSKPGGRDPFPDGGGLLGVNLFRKRRRRV